ncbi:MAG TPA: LON peptidase substrate-binding domain-containing protein [Steroidobacteraceae bacterium]|nr:LON peptidase substrate-binding domain-containing protein [Steroidobacteraceae bacterium]
MLGARADHQEAQSSADLDAVRSNLFATFERYAKQNSPALQHLLPWLRALDIGKLADAMASHLPLPLGHRQQVLEIADVRKRLLYLNSATETLR